MYQRIVVVVAATLFGLQALVAWIVTDLYDREFPQAIGAESRVNLDFGGSLWSDAEALDALTDLDAQLRLGLVKVAPDLATDATGSTGEGQVFVPLDEELGEALPAEFRWFHGEVAEVLGAERLAHSPPDGTYLVTGDAAQLDAFTQSLRDAGVEVHRTDASVFDSFQFVLREASFGAAVLAAFALVAALALFWLSMRARGRALRVLGGTPTLRIQAEDLGGFGAGLLVSAGVVTLAAGAVVGLARDWLHVVPFMQVLAGLVGVVIAASLLAALVMSASAWPSAAMLATRQPAVKPLRTAAVVIQALTFLLVVAAAGPAWAAYQASAARAAEAAHWHRLDEQVMLRFAMVLPEMDAVEPQVGELIREAEQRDLLALSYTFTEAQWGDDFGDYSAVAFVNQRWLDLLAADAAGDAAGDAPGDAPADALAPVPFSEVEPVLLGSFASQWEIWARSDERSGAEQLARLRYATPTDGYRLPVSTGGGQLEFLDDVLVAVVPSVHGAIDDSNLTSMASSGQLLFTGLGPTQRLMEQHGLAPQQLRDAGFDGQLRVVYVAEEGILHAQFTRYVTWLLNLSLVALVVAFAVAAAVSAVITARLQARRDFPLRLAGRSWPRILQTRVAREVAAGAGLVAVVLLLQRPEQVAAVLLVAGVGLLLVPLTHYPAARWCFASVGRRRF